MAVTPNAFKFLESWAAELKSQSQRVRDLIGPKHWPTDGAHKEVLLQHMCRRHLPAGTMVGRGFVVVPHLGLSSTEQDVLIVDVSKEGPLLQTDSLIMCLPEQVLAAIAVKSAYRKDQLQDSLRGLASLHALVSPHIVRESDLWTAVCFFDVNSDDVQSRADEIARTVREAIPPSLTKCSAIPNWSGPDIVFEAFGHCYKTHVSDGEQDNPGLRVSVADHPGLGPALAIAELIDHVALRLGATRSEFGELIDSLPWEGKVINSSQ